jgi:hypothetical protein
MTEPWLGHYLSAEPIAREGSFHLHAARRASDGGPCVVVSAAPIAEPRAAREALERLASAHDAVSHPAIPRAVRVEEALLGEHDGTPFVELASEGVLDGASALERLIDARAHLGFGEAEALLDLLVGALRAASAARGGPFRLGRLSLSSLLVSTRGTVHVVGLGHPVATTGEDGRLTTSLAVFEAPEVAAGASADEGAEVVALLGLRRALVPHLDLPPSLARVLRGEPAEGGDTKLAAAIGALEARAVASSARDRGTLADLDGALSRVRALLGIDADPEGLAKLLSDLALGLPIQSDWELSTGDVTEETTVVSASGAWIEVPAQGRQRVELGPSLRRMLALLLARHRDEPTRTTTTWELLEAGWPGENLLADAGANRVYAAIKRLRNMGLRGVIERHGDGYRIGPHASVTEIDE